MPLPTRTWRPPTRLGPQRLRVGDPVGHVDRVYRLLDEMIARQPGKIEPVPQLVLHFGLAGLAKGAAHRTVHEVIAADQPHGAELSVANPPQGVQAIGFVTALEAHGDFQIFFLATVLAASTARTPGASTASGFSM